ncbi:sensor histidine kinase [Promicromonospora sukumoe]|uniref:Oxygen sensor histidine kinase NreB n=1 Tax=Promicromonospora sukumoe TaxID=88382 RepID=A0A7W3PE27_9MICO|nr:sensor histidine kinase [Promicromonospora sukumoe]MBA8808468.1 signal transduction histidine kinase [Promicromonospora sukumoe]
MTRPSSSAATSSPATRGLVVGLDLLLAVLVVVAVVQAPPGVGWPAALAGGALLAVYVAGRAVVRVHERSVDTPRGAWWPDVAWVAGLTALWLVLLWLSPAGLWVAFPLMLLQLHVLGPRRGVVAVALTAVVAVADGLLTRSGPGEPWTGYVLGPLLGAAVAVGVVLGIEAFVREAQSRQRTVDELTRARRHLAVAERERAVTDERARLARDIHDTLAQSLSAIELLLRAAEDAVGSDEDRARALVGQARSAARDGLAEARRVVQDLTPADLDRTTLLGALRRVADRTAAGLDGTGSSPLAVTVHTVGPPRPLPVPLEIALLRITQSALANVDEHAGASRAEVTLTYEPGSVTLRVADDGVGLDPAPAAGSGGRGFGIPAMRSRVRELGGELTLEGQPGAGTVLTVTLPVRPGEDT